MGRYVQGTGSSACHQEVHRLKLGSDNIEAIPEAQLNEQTGTSYDCRDESRTLSWLLEDLEVLLPGF